MYTQERQTVIPSSIQSLANSTLQDGWSVLINLSVYILDTSW